MSKFASLLGLGASGGGGGGGGILNTIINTPEAQKRIAEKSKAKQATEVADAAKRAKQALLRRRGRGSTILTGGRGLLDDLASKSPEAKSTLG